jgi:hypothetical protein
MFWYQFLVWASDCIPPNYRCLIKRSNGTRHVYLGPVVFCTISMVRGYHIHWAYLPFIQPKCRERLSSPEVAFLSWFGINFSNNTKSFGMKRPQTTTNLQVVKFLCGMDKRYVRMRYIIFIVMIVCRYSSIILLNILHKEYLACKPFVNVKNEITPLNMGISGAHHSSSTLIDCLAIINWQLETKVGHVMWHLMLHDKWWGPLQWTWHTNFNAKLSKKFSVGNMRLKVCVYTQKNYYLVVDDCSLFFFGTLFLWDEGKGVLLTTTTTTTVAQLWYKV